MRYELSTKEGIDSSSVTITITLEGPISRVVAKEFKCLAKAVTTTPTEKTVVVTYSCQQSQVGMSKHTLLEKYKVVAEKYSISDEIAAELYRSLLSKVTSEKKQVVVKKTTPEPVVKLKPVVKPKVVIPTTPSGS